MRILVLQADDDKGLGHLEPPLRAAGASFDVCSAARERPRLDGHDAVVALPGVDNPPDATPAVERTREVLRAALAAGVPTLGVCLGAELLAEAAGGSTAPCPPEFGFYPVTMRSPASADPLLGHLPPVFEVFQAHAYAAEALPSGAVALAHSPAGLQAFRIGAAAWGIQFHPEATAGMVAAWMTSAGPLMRAHGVDAPSTVARARTLEFVWERWAAGIADGFAEVVAARRAPASAG